MVTRHRLSGALLRAASLVAVALSAPAALRAVDYPVIAPSKEMFRSHRDKFLARLPAGAIVVLHSAPERTMSHDTAYVYRQDSDFYYVTGLEEPGAIAVFRPAAANGKRYLLFVRPHDARREMFEGPRPGPEGAIAQFGADAAFAISELEATLQRGDAGAAAPASSPAASGPPPQASPGSLSAASSLYLSDGGDAVWGEKFRLWLDGLRGHDAAPATVVDAREILHEMRLIKDADELGLLRRSAEISARAHARAMAAAAPGRYEFEVQQALDGYCLANGARRMAYPSIAASGPNSVFLHWDKNDRMMKDGDVLLNDSGAEYGYYATDITRTYPVSGRFSPEQRAVYEGVLAAQKAAIARIRPGVTHDEIEQTSARAQTEALVRLGLLSGNVDQLVAERAFYKFTRHGISHWVGLDVHDAGRMRVGNASRTLAAGMVLTVEPGIYIPNNMPGVDPKWWNIGVRIEDTLAVTATGSECLSCGAPREIADVEKAVGAKGKN
ncbi:MAG: aminopeptidase P N-terminal domain-containing protein [Acidobacteriota bacterium]